MPQILIFGDSIAYGRWDTSRGGWASQLIDLYMEKNLADPNTYHEVYNLSIDGDDSKNLLNRFEFEATQRKVDTNATIIFAIGKNDSCFLKDKNSFITSPIIFKKNIKKLIGLAKKHTSKIIFVSAAAIDGNKTIPTCWDKNLYYKNECLKKYNSIIKSACLENKTSFIDLFEKFKKLDYKNLLEDGVHPNSEGHKIIFEIIKNYLEKNKII